MLKQFNHDFDELDDRGKDLWDKKTRFLQEEKVDAKQIYQKLGFMQNWKVICISRRYFAKGGKNKSD